LAGEWSRVRAGPPNRPSPRIIPEEAKVNLQLAQPELARATELLRQRTIRSPINGIVVARMLGGGEYAFDQAQLVTISQIDPLNVEVFVPLNHRSLAKRLISVSNLLEQDTVSAAIARILLRASASVAGIDMCVQVAPFSSIGLLRSFSVLVLDQNMSGEWF
jgi:hypothetical protein